MDSASQLRSRASLGVLRDEPAPRPGMEHWCAPADDAPVANVFTVDLEDWPVAVMGPDEAITSRVVENTKRCLQILAWHRVKATFFVLTRVAERYPDLVREVHDAGHEIASHGHGHELLTEISPRHFAADVRRSVDIIREITGTRPIGYRAPAFSVVRSTRWAGPILADLGFKYSSSILPVRNRRHGIADEPRAIHRWADCRLIECPPATVHLAGRNWPIAGGGYFRMMPGPLARAAIRSLNRVRMPAILYFHPYELDAAGVYEHRSAGVRVGAMRQWTQELFRGRIEIRLHRLLESFRFTTMVELLQHAA